MKRRNKNTRGVRNVGGGRKDHFKDFKEKVKAFVERERSYGHTLSSDDLYLEFKFEASFPSQRKATSPGC